MAQNGRKNGDGALLLALAEGKSVRQAAKAAGVGERTVYRRLEDAEFRRRLSTLRTRLLSEAVGTLAGASTEAAATLRRLLKAKSESVKLAAARSILEHSVRMRDAAELAERVELLEQRLAHHPRL